MGVTDLYPKLSVLPSTLQVDRKIPFPIPALKLDFIYPDD